MSDKIIAIAENGQPVTQAMVDKWCEEYDAGNYFPENEETTAVFWGVPNQTLSKTITFKVSEQLEHALKDVQISLVYRQVIFVEMPYQKPCIREVHWRGNVQ